MTEDLRIDRRFRGPPDSGNGGYVCGWMAQHLGGDVAVRLERPPPLDRPLQLREASPGLELFDAGQRIATARSSDFDLELPDPPAPAEVREATGRFRGFTDHVFPGCFVCGPERGDGDGLRIFPGPLAERDAVASPWRPDASLGTGEVRPEFVWAALDCPGVYSFPQPENRALVLGELAAHLAAPVRIGTDYVVVGWALSHEGRKHRTGSAIFDAAGGCAGYALGTWIEIPRQTPASKRKLEPEGLPDGMAGARGANSRMG